MTMAKTALWTCHDASTTQRFMNCMITRILVYSSVDSRIHYLGGGAAIGSVLFIFSSNHLAGMCQAQRPRLTLLVASPASPQTLFKIVTKLTTATSSSIQILRCALSHSGTSLFLSRPLNLLGTFIFSSISALQFISSTISLYSRPGPPDSRTPFSILPTKLDFYIISCFDQSSPINFA
jgi:hypothetical protein